MHNLTEDQAAMAAGIGASIVAARSVGRPDPTDRELHIDLELSGFPGLGAKAESFQRAKEAALYYIEAGIAGLSLLLFVTAFLMVGLGLGGGA